VGQSKKSISVGVQQEGFKTALFYGLECIQTSPFYLVNIQVYVAIPAFARTKRNCMFISVALFWVLTVLSRPLLIFYSMWQVLSRYIRRCLRSTGAGKSAKNFFALFALSCALSSSGYPFRSC